MNGWHLPLLTLAGVAVGFINVMAAGGSLISMPLLIMLGLPPAMANGTNRVAILVQNITAISAFQRRGFFDLPRSLGLGLCTVPGAVLGAVAAIEIDPTWFKRILAGALVGALLLTLRPRKASKGAQVARPVWAHLAAVAVGFYGGFLQAGVGFLLIPLLYHLLALDLVRVNMHKVFIIGLYTVPVLLIFAVQGQVWWLGGLALSIGNAAGAWIGTHLTITRGERLIRLVFTVAVLAMAVKLVLV